jgi:D-threonine aldolase
MDSAYGRLGLPFAQALFVLATVVSSCDDWSVADAGLKAFGMDHGPPELPGSNVWFCSDEHTTFEPPRAVGDRVALVPAHVDPTMAYHERLHVVAGDVVVDTWPIDLRGW